MLAKCTCYKSGLLHIPCEKPIKVISEYTYPYFKSSKTLYSTIILRTHYCRKHNVCVCLYIAYIVCGSASLNIKTLYFFFCILALSAAATIDNIKIRYDAKTPQFALFGTCVICVFYSIALTFALPGSFCSIVNC